MHNKWIKTQIRNIYRKINPNSNPNEVAYKTLKHDFIDNLSANEMEHRIKCFNGLTSEKDKWNFINEALKRPNDDLKIANLLNYRFSELGNYQAIIKAIFHR